MKTSKCKKHGIFNEDEAYVCYNEKYKDKKLLRCRKCHHEKNIETMTKTFQCDVHGILTSENSYSSIEKGRPRLKCRICVHEYRKKRYADTREKSIIQAAIWKKENRDRVNKQVAQDKINNPEKYKKWNDDYYERNKKDINTRAICRAHGLDISSYEFMFKAQDSKCAICGKTETRKFKGKLMRLCVDHNHETGKIRGLLCHDCNTGLGKFLDSIDVLTKAAIYLMDHE